MSEKRPNNKIAWILLFACMVISSSYAYHIQLNQKTTAELKKNANDMFINLTDQVGMKQNELHDLQNKILSMRGKDDVLKSDIKLYIKTTHPKVPSVVANEIATHAVDLGRKHQVSPELIIGIIKVESAFNPMAVGPKTKYGHARGLMQVMPEWAPKLGLKNQYEFHEIDKGIESGIKVFKIHLDEGEGDISTGLYYYVNRDKEYVGNVYAAMGKFVAFRSTINNDSALNVETDIDRNGDTKQLPEDKKETEE